MASFMFGVPVGMKMIMCTRSMPSTRVFPLWKLAACDRSTFLVGMINEGNLQLGGRGQRVEGRHLEDVQR